MAVPGKMKLKAKTNSILRNQQKLAKLLLEALSLEVMSLEVMSLEVLSLEALLRGLLRGVLFL